MITFTYSDLLIYLSGLGMGFVIGMVESKRLRHKSERKMTERFIKDLFEGKLKKHDIHKL